MRRIPWFAAAAAILILPAGGWSRQSGQKQGQQQEQASAPAAQSGPGAGPQQDSLAAAARKAREQKKEAPKAAKIFTNENLPSQGGISSVGAARAAESGEAAAPAGARTAAAGSDEKAWRDKFAGLRHKLERDQADLEVMQREIGVLNVQHYNDPVKAMQQGLTRGDINKKNADFDAKKKEVEADKQALSDAEDDLRKSGGDPGWAR